MHALPVVSAHCLASPHWINRASPHRINRASPHRINRAGNRAHKNRAGKRTHKNRAENRARNWARNKNRTENKARPMGPGPWAPGSGLEFGAKVGTCAWDFWKNNSFPTLWRARCNEYRREISIPDPNCEETYFYNNSILFGLYFEFALALFWFSPCFNFMLTLF